jgi:hypothetical protein
MAERIEQKPDVKPANGLLQAYRFVHKTAAACPGGRSKRDGGSDTVLCSLVWSALVDTHALNLQ